jgi:hypothetical protein
LAEPPSAHGFEVRSHQLTDLAIHFLDQCEHLLVAIGGPRQQPDCRSNVFLGDTEWAQDPKPDLVEALDLLLGEDSLNSGLVLLSHRGHGHLHLLELSGIETAPLPALIVLAASALVTVAEEVAHCFAGVAVDGLEFAPLLLS